MQQFFQKTVDTKTEALVAACMNGDIEVVKKLIAGGANINAYCLMKKTLTYTSKINLGGLLC